MLVRQFLPVATLGVSNLLWFLGIPVEQSEVCPYVPRSLGMVLTRANMQLLVKRSHGSPD